VKKLSIQIKIGMLMLLAVLLLLATGYLSYRNFSSIVSSIPIDVSPERILLSIREISTDLEHAENSVRIYMITNDTKDLKSYYAIINNIDEKVSLLHEKCSNDSGLLVQVDTISKLIEENILNWNQLLYLSKNDTVDEYLKKLSDQLAIIPESENADNKGILQRVFGRNKKSQVDDRLIAEDLQRMEFQDSITREKIMTRESKLAVTGGEIRERFYALISRMEQDILKLIDAKASAAGLLAGKTYRWLAMFSVAGTLLAILVLFLVVRYARRSYAYQVALEHSKEEAEKLARMKEIFMANMSHEIRTPVTAISGFTEQLLHERVDPNTSRLLKIIKSSSDHLARIIDDILDFSKLQSDKLILEKVNFDIRDIVEDVYAMFESQARRNNTQLSYSLSSEIPQVLLGDPYRLRQIMLNLISNAVKFTNDGEVRFNIRANNKSQVDIGQPGQIELLMEFIDTGIGIDESKIDMIFEDFTQGEVSTSRKYGGTGLGLSIVKKLVELHNGSIECKSKKNHGTTITCRIPYLTGDHKQLKRDIKPHLSVPEEIKKLRILIVDDEEYIRLLFKTILERWNVRHDVANNGVEALDLIKSSHYDLLFMDIRMPGLDGFRITQFIRNELKIKNSDMPVICISAVSLNTDWQKYKESGMDAYLPKPFTEEVLMTTILSVIRNSGLSGSDDANIENLGNGHGIEEVNLRNLYHISGGDEQFIKQMLITFIESTKNGLNAMDKAIASGNTEQVADLAHKMLPPCRHIGAKNLYNHLKQIEESVKNNKGIKVLESLIQESSKDFESLTGILNEEIGKFN
jgi:signal transduction histidine kinase/CheY-like chemotaxis protein/HPt (histidine-containing phosphotransfer) domain-containing protein